MIAVAAAATLAPFVTTGTSVADGGWREGHQHRIRLVIDTAAPGWAGVELAMSKGWKTYWRVPGDAGGVPPEFDWSKSKNLKGASVLYPAPSRLVDKGGETIGYKDHVVFPIRIEAADPAQPVELALAMSFGVCREICIPAEAQLAAASPHSGAAAASGVVSAPGEPIASALARVPLAEPAAGAPLLKALRVDTSAQRLVIDVALPAGAGDGDAFVEGPIGVYIPMTTKGDGAPAGQQRFHADLAGVEPKELAAGPLTVTLTGGGKASEFRRVPQ